MISQNFAQMSRLRVARFLLIALTGMPLFLLGVPANAALLNLSNWSAVAYDGTAGTTNDPIWTLEAGNTMVRQSVNAKTSIFISDFSIDHSIIAGFSGNFEVQTAIDDDQIGLVFGIQDPGAGSNLASYYLFQWKAGTTPKAGAAIRKLIGAEPFDADLEGIGDTANSTILVSNDNLNWQSLIEYSFSVTFSVTGFNLTILDNLMTEILNWDVADTTFTSGQFGFYNSSQKEVLYSAQLIPIPPAIILFMSALGLLGWIKRRN